MGEGVRNPPRRLVTGATTSGMLGTATTDVILGTAMAEVISSRAEVIPATTASEVSERFGTLERRTHQLALLLLLVWLQRQRW